MELTKKITHKSRMVALVVYGRQLKQEGVHFLTDELNALQIGTHNVKKGKKYNLHYHVLDKFITVKSIQEILYVVEGKILVTLTTKKGVSIDRVELKSGDSILLIDEAHEIEVLEDTQLFEVKQGPYPGVHFAKVYLS